MSFPPGTEMFQFPGFASYTYVFSARYSLRSGFPHSEIRGSTIARISPRLIAACHVLHRLLAPRHPPNALVLLHTSHHRPRAGPNRTHKAFTRQADPPHSGRQGHSTQFHTHWMISQPHRQSSRSSAAADHHPPNPIHRLKEHAQHPGRAQGGKLLREVDTTLRRCRFHENLANQAHPQTTSRGGQQTKSAATRHGG